MYTMHRKDGTGWLVPLIIVVVLLLLPTAYIGAYFAMIDVDASSVGDALLSPPAYRFGAIGVQRLFAPAHYVDRHYVRSSRWIEIEFRAGEFTPAIPNVGVGYE